MTTGELIAAIAAASPADLPSITAAVTARVIAIAQSASMPVVQQPDELLTVKEAARLLGKSLSWLYHEHRKNALPFVVRDIGKAPRFSRRGLEKYIAERVSQ